MLTIFPLSVSRAMNSPTQEYLAESLSRFNASHRTVPAIRVEWLGGHRWQTHYADGKTRPDYFFDHMTNIAVIDAFLGPQARYAQLEVIG